MKKQDMCYSKVFKRILTFCILIASVFSVVAQDLIVTNNGDTYKVKNLEIGQTSVFYTLAEDSTNATHRMDKSEILIIKFEDGRTMTMKEAGTAVSSPATVNPAAAKSVSEEVVKQNETMIRNHNLRSLVYDGTKRKGKDASTMFLALGVKPSSALYDGNLSVRLVPGYFSARDEKFVPYSEVEYFSVLAFSPYFVTELENHTDKTLYVDLGNSFVMRNQESSPYYVPSVTSSMSSSTGGGSVNLGAVTGAMGIGGAVGTLASGVNVGGSSTSGEVTTTYAQRVVAIPPMSVYRLSPVLLAAKGQRMSDYVVCDKLSGFSGDCVDLFVSKSLPGIPELKIGDNLFFDEDDEVFNLSTFFTYYFSESMTESQKIKTDYYLKEILGVGRYKKAFYFDFYITNVNDSWHSMLVFPAFRE